MEEYITYEFLMKLNDASKSERKALKRRKAIEIFEGENGRISPKEIAKWLETTEAQVISYLGKTRIKIYDSLNGNTRPNETSKPGRPTKPSGRLTFSKVSRIVAERNQRIKAFYESGVAIEDIAKREHISLAQVREVFMYLGLPIYSLSELRKIQKDIDRKAKAGERERRRKIANRERREKIAEEKRRRKREDELKAREKEFEERTGGTVINNFEDLIREMKQLLEQGKSTLAIELGNFFLSGYENILTTEEREKLARALNELKTIKTAYLQVQAREEAKSESLEEAFEK